MINTKVLISAFLTTAALATATFAESTWTLEDCLKQAKKASLKLESAKLREQSADISIKQAKTGNYPTVSASIQNTLYDHPFVYNEDHYRLNLGISGSYTLWDGGATSLNVESKTLTKEATALATQQTERSVQESVLNAYMSLLAASENLRTADASVELAQAEFEHYSKLYEAGSITKKDLTQSQSNVLQKQTSQLTAQLSRVLQECLLPLMKPGCLQGKAVPIRFPHRAKQGGQQHHRAHEAQHALLSPFRAELHGQCAKDGEYTQESNGFFHITPSSGCRT